MEWPGRRTTVGVLAVAALGASPAAAQARSAWSSAGRPAVVHAGHAAEVRASRFKAFKLDASALGARLSTAPEIGLRARALAQGSGTVVSVPAPDGTLQRFELQESPVMEAGLAARHPDIKTYAGRGLDDPAATIRADQTPLGFHASVRSAAGAWYVDPYYHLDDSVYVSYFGRDLADPHGGFLERGPLGMSAGPFAAGVKRAAAADATVPLRTYRLALVTDPSYSTYFHGDQNPANVTAAKVTLMNRVDQIYEDETAIRMVLINDTDKLNLDTPALATGANGPCGAAPCFTPAQLAGCGSQGQANTLARNRIVIGQIVGAGNYDIGHIGLGLDGGGVAALAVVGGNNKGQGCTGLPTPVGDFYAVDYVAHEMGHQFAGNHTFNGTQANCGGTNRSPGSSVEPGSGTSIMAYAGICRQDDLQPHSDPYWSQRSYDEITAYTSTTRANVNEVQTASLRDFDGADSFRLSYGGRTTNPFVRGLSYTLLDIQGALQGNEVQGVRLSGYDAPDDSYTLDYHGVDTVPIVRGQNDTAAGAQNALQGGNEQQVGSLASFSAATQSFQLQVNGTTTPRFGQGGQTIGNGNIAAALNAILGAGTVTSAGAGATGFTLTFGGSLANKDAPPVTIVSCTAPCLASVRESAKGGTAISSWPAGATVSASPPADSGYSLSFAGTLNKVDVDSLSVTNPNGATGTVAEDNKGGSQIMPAGAVIAVAGWGGAATLDDTGFQVTFAGNQPATAGTLAGLDLDMLGLAINGAGGFVMETAHGGPPANQGFLVTDTGNHAPVVTTTPSFTIPTRTPFSLTGGATDADNDPLTYMWEQNDPGVGAGTTLVNNTKTNGPLFRQFGVAAAVSRTDTLLTPSPGENHVDADPMRVFPDMAQILAGNTNAATGACPAAPASPAVVPQPQRDCFSEFLPTADYLGAGAARALNFRLTARDHRPGGGGVGNAATKLTVAPLAGPFRVTSQAVAQVLFLGPPTQTQTITWDVAGTDQPPVGVSQVKISMSTDGGRTFPYVLDAATPNDGSDAITLPNVTASAARIKVEAIGSVFFDVNHGDLSLVPAPTSAVGGSVPATLVLALGTPASFGAFAAGVTHDYDATSTATVVSTAGDAALSVSDPSPNAPGHLVNGAFSLPSAVQARANAGTLAAVGASPATLLSYTAPVSNDAVALGFRQHIGDTDALRAGTYAKTLTFTLSTTRP